MLVPIHRAVSAVLRVMLVAFVTISARAQHGVLRSKHWLTIAPAAAAAVVLARPDTWAWLAPNTWAW